MGLKAEERRADPQLRDLSFLGGGFLEGGLTWVPRDSYIGCYLLGSDPTMG